MLGHHPNKGFVGEGGHVHGAVAVWLDGLMQTIHGIEIVYCNAFCICHGQLLKLNVRHVIAIKSYNTVVFAAILMALANMDTG